ncbi:flagellar basal body-associated protein FliL [Brenneria tiliae]|uniref:flagellar basal body-associated protein FliL n=1 Tax=Brenneria tiliae TaxID=2914984 RepID=UPI002014BD55|nr:flagellar basal body-associated protein FliL [Brenneria tiliae]MCL2899833.1 flagellar basal body-associated protein FliL [Brenneria tiliae]MCL2904678.1 flagellar basal body-associated protein FliL [Brenneria tiliae]
MSEQALTSGRKRSIWPVVLIVITLLTAIAGGAAWWFLYTPTDATQALKVVPPPAPVFMPLDTFTVNLQNPDNDLDRVLYVGFTLRLPDEATHQQLSNYLPEVRSRLLLLLSRQNSASLSTEQGKQQLVEEIKQVLAPPLVSGQAEQTINDVLFTAFILR